MTITLTSGEIRRVMIGQALSGTAITQVTIEAGDERHPLFLEWFADVVLTRLVKR